MKIHEYHEGKNATENFEEGMKALFNAPKDEVVQAEKKAKKRRASRDQTIRKPHVADKN
jgi:hypothetical protein